MTTRRAFLGTLAGGLLTAPLAAEPQQRTLLVIGYLSSRSPSESAHIVAAFRQGLKEAGFAIPLVFAMGGDPVKLGVVASLARPGGNITGVAFLVNGLAAKHVQLLQELAPKASVIGFLVNPKDPNTASDTKETQEAVDTLGHTLVVVRASTASEVDTAFTRGCFLPSRRSQRA